jgi:AcrR family transcriptional regulator
VDDIASEIGMSRANVYRFVPSRDAINESSYGRVINEVDEIAFAIARTNGPASEKLELTLSRSCNVWDNAAMESFFSSLKTERTACKFIAPETVPRPMCSTISSASTTRGADTRHWAI